jgi:hypothetical protein
MKENSVSLTLFYLCYFNTHCLNSWTFLSFFSVWVCINTFQVLYLKPCILQIKLNIFQIPKLRACLHGGRILNPCSKVKTGSRNSYGKHTL